MKKKDLTLKLMIAELHRAFELFNKDLFGGELPTPAILIQSKGNRKNVLGWFTVNTAWADSETKEEKHEINLVAEYVNRGVYPVLSTLLHEMIHFYCALHEIKDTTRNNTYHNDKFKQVAESHGLICEHDKKIGWSLTKLQPFVMDLIDSNKFKNEDFTFGRKDFGAGEKEKTKKKSSVKKYVCPRCGQIARATNEKAELICGKCFTESDNTDIIFLVMEQPEGAEGTEGVEGTEGTNEPTVEPTKALLTGEYTCKSCGSIHWFERGEVLTCVDCEGIEFAYTTIEIIEPVNTPTPVEFIDTVVIDTEESLNDGAGNMVEVIQPIIAPAPAEEEEEEEENENTTLVKQLTKEFNIPEGVAPLEYWTVEKITKVIGKVNTYMESINENILPMEAIQEVRINSRKAKVCGSCYYTTKKVGRGVKYLVEALELRALHLENDSTTDIIDTIIHEYIHGWLYVTTKKNQKHNDLFKRWANKLGVNTKLGR